MTEPPYTKQTGQFKVRDDSGEEVKVAIISRFVDVSWMGSKTREWSENKKKRYFAPDGREGSFVEGTDDKFFFEDDPDRIFTKIS